MSMDFSEFTFRLGADPRSRDPEFLQARRSSPDFRDAAEQAERFEDRLERALSLQAPASLLARLEAIPGYLDHPDHRATRRPAPWRFALAASLLVTVGVAGMIWKVNSGWDSVEDYVVDHYHHDGLAVLALADEQFTGNVPGMLAEFDAAIAPELAAVVRVIKRCPTPDGRGVHMILETERGLVTLIYMPETPVTDGEHIVFGDSEAVLVRLHRGSAVIIGAPSQNVADLHSLVQQSFVTAAGTT